jgi:hypothetical protein
VLVDTQLELQALQSVRLVVGLAPDVPAAPSPFKFSFDKDAGRAFIEDGTTRWPLLERRKDGDAVLGLRPWLVDRFNHIYRAQLDLASLKVEQDGPLRWSLRVEGVHKRADEAGCPSTSTTSWYAEVKAAPRASSGRRNGRRTTRPARRLPATCRS